MRLATVCAALLGLSVCLMASPFPSDVPYVGGVPVAQDANDGTPDIFDAVNLLLGTSYAGNTDLTGLFREPDYIWETTSDDAEVILIGMTAGYWNQVGTYVEGPRGLEYSAPLITAGGYFGFKGSGTQADPFFEVATLSLPQATEFGWYLNVNVGKPSGLPGVPTESSDPIDPVNPKLTYYSDPKYNQEVIVNGTVMEPAGLDHMMTFGLGDVGGRTLYVLEDGKAKGKQFEDAYLLCWEDLYQNHPDWWDYDYDDMMYVVAKVKPVGVPEPGTLSLFMVGLAGMLVALRRKSKK